METNYKIPCKKVVYNQPGEGVDLQTHRTHKVRGGDDEVDGCVQDLGAKVQQQKSI